MSAIIDEQKKKKSTPATACRDARELIWAHRYRLALGMFLMIVNRLVGLVLPASSKYLIDNVILKHQSGLLLPLALIAGAATLVQAFSSFALSQVLGVAAQRAITEMCKSVQEHVARLPVRYFDSTQTGILISRIMTDAEGIRNLVGTGLVQLVGSLVTAALALAVLFYLNWKLTSVTLLARGAHRLFRNVARSMTAISGVTAFSTIIVGAIGVILILVGGRDILNGQMMLGDFFMYMIFTGLVAMPLVEIANIGTQITEAFAGLDRIRDLKQMATEDENDFQRQKCPAIVGEIAFQDV